MTGRKGFPLATPPDDKALHGSLTLTSITDLLQFLAASTRSGAIRIIRETEDVEGMIYFDKGEVLSARAGEQTGMEGFATMLNWDRGTFFYLPGIAPLETTIGLPVQHAILEAIVLLDNRSKHEANDNEPGINEGSAYMEQVARESTDVMNDLLEISGIDAVVVVGRDGFVIESAGSSTRINIDELGASLAHAVNGIEEMGTELNINCFQDMFIEYGRAVIMCKPVGDAIAAIVTPDASKLGIIRHKTKKLFQDLALSF
jgi:predicted regulator of Ras-like GTPase activity (Roadblock/LC7/MglB family)